MRNLIITGLAASLLFSTSTAIASDRQYCSEQTLFGSYIFAATGSDTKPIAFAGMNYFNGAGRLISTRKDSDNTDANLRGTYTVGRNCRGEIRYANGRTVTLFVAPSGELTTFVVTSGQVAANTQQRVSKYNLLGVNP